jgi:hypothetical protein
MDRMSHVNPKGWGGLASLESIIDRSEVQYMYSACTCTLHWSCARQMNWGEGIFKYGSLIRMYTL